MGYLGTTFLLFKKWYSGEFTVMVIVQFLLPIGVMAFLLYNLNRLDEKDFKSKFRVIYENLRSTPLAPIHTLLVPIIFMVKRLIIVIAVF